MATLSSPSNLQGIYSTSPRRSISWFATDSAGNQEIDPATGQPVQSQLFPQIVVREHGTDQLEITKHPVEQGTTISDHAYRMPAKLQIEGAWSFAPAGASGSTQVQATDSSLLQSLYNVLLQLLRQRTFVTVVTGKRLYSNMLLGILDVETDEATENVLSFVAQFEEVLVATTQTVTIPDPSVMKTPSINAPTTNQGNTALQTGSAANLGAIQSVLPSQFSSPQVAGGAT